MSPDGPATGDAPVNADGPVNADSAAGAGAQERELESVVKQTRALATGLPGPLSRLAVTVGELRVDIEWQAPTVVAAPASTVQPTAVPAALPADAADASENGADPAARGHAVLAPLIGTFYLAPEPGAPPFVAEGDLVEEGQQVGIVEAMKIMNPIEADRPGRVARILAEDGAMVEFEQELLIIEPDDGEE